MGDRLDSLRANEQYTTLLSYILVSAMMACLMLSIVLAQQAIAPGWRSGGMVLFAILVSLETFYTQRLRKKMVILGAEWFFFYAGELLVLALALRIFQFLVSPGVPVELAALKLDIWGAVINPQYKFSLIAVGIVWLVSLWFAGPLEALRITPQLIQMEQEAGIAEERATARQGLVDLILIIGVLMVLIAGLLRFPRTAGWLNISIPPVSVINILVYFMLGLVLLSLTQFNILHWRWSLNHLPVSGGLSRRWAGYSLISLVILVGIALLLPTRFSLPLLAILGWCLNLLLTAARFLIWLLLLPVMLLGSLFAGEPVEEDLVPPPPLSTPAPFPQSPTEAAFPMVIRDLVLWIVLITLAIYSLMYFYNARRAHIARLRRFPFLDWLLTLLTALVSRIRDAGHSANRALRQSLQRNRTPAARPERPPWGYLRLRNLSARDRILFYYLALVRRSGESGLPRRASQTPYEYAASLSEALQAQDLPPDDRSTVVPDIQAITEQFTEARYSRHDVTEQQVREVKSIWERLRRLLRHPFGANRVG